MTNSFAYLRVLLPAAVLTGAVAGCVIRPAVESATAYLVDPGPPFQVDAAYARVLHRNGRAFLVVTVTGEKRYTCPRGVVERRLVMEGDRRLVDLEEDETTSKPRKGAFTSPPIPLPDGLPAGRYEVRTGARYAGCPGGRAYDVDAWSDSSPLRQPTITLTAADAGGRR